MSYRWPDWHDRVFDAWCRLAWPNANGGDGAAGAARDANAWAARFGALACHTWLTGAIGAHDRAPPFDIASIVADGTIWPIEETIVDRVPFCALRYFARGAPSRQPARRTKRVKQVKHDAVLICAPLAGHHAVMLRETVETLLPDADVYITDWIDARDVPADAGPFALDDYVLTLMRFMDCVQRRSGAPHVLAVCQAAPPALAAAALRADAGGHALASLTLMGGPIDARVNPTALGRFAREHDAEWFRAWAIDVVPAPYTGATRRVYPGYLQQATLMAAHPERPCAMWLRYWSSGILVSAAALARARRSLDEYAIVLDMPEAYFLDTVRTIFQEVRLARGCWRISGRPVQPEALAATPLCTVEGNRDDITGAGQTHAAHTLCGSGAARLALTIDDCDHYDLFTGPRWRTTIRPALLRFWHTRRSRTPLLHMPAAGASSTRSDTPCPDHSDSRSR